MKRQGHQHIDPNTSEFCRWLFRAEAKRVEARAVDLGLHGAFIDEKRDTCRVPKVAMVDPRRPSLSKSSLTQF